MNDTTLSMDGFPRLPCLILQYDPPWDDSNDGTHFHYMPIDALADAQLTFGVASDIEAVEFHILNHTADAQLTTRKAAGLRGVDTRKMDRGLAIRNLIDQVGNTLMAEVVAMDITDDESMMKTLLAVSTEVGGGGFGAARASFAAAPAMDARTSARELLISDASEHGFDRSAKGYAELEVILANNADLVEKSRMRVLEAKYGAALRKMMAVRRMENDRNMRRTP